MCLYYLELPHQPHPFLLLRSTSLLRIIELEHRHRTVRLYLVSIHLQLRNIRLVSAGRSKQFVGHLPWVGVVGPRERVGEEVIRERLLQNVRVEDVEEFVHPRGGLARGGETVRVLVQTLAPCPLGIRLVVCGGDRVIQSWVLQQCDRYFNNAIQFLGGLGSSHSLSAF